LIRHDWESADIHVSVWSQFQERRITMRGAIARSPVLLCLLSSCVGSQPMDNAGPSNGQTNNPSPTSSTGANAATPALALDGIWSGDVDLVAPGFYGPPIDRFVLSFANGKLRSSGFDKLGLPRTYGDAATDFPLAGHRLVQPGGATGFTHDVTVQEATWGATSFRFCFHALSAADTPDTDFVECISGTLDAVGLHVQHSIKGSLYVAQIDAHASGVLTSPAMATAARGVLAGKWAGDVELIRSDTDPAPSRLVVEFSADNQLTYFQFDNGIFGHTFGTQPGDFPLTGTAVVTGGDSANSYISEVRESSFLPTSFAFRHHVVNDGSTTATTDYVEGLSGTIQNGQLAIHWDFQGVLWIAPFTNSADGLLVAQP
jgi:hypothetical protein